MIDNIREDLFYVPDTLADAVQIQNELAKKVSIINDLSTIKIIAGVDVGYNPKTNQAKAALVIIDAQSLAVIDEYIESMPVDFPYISGFLSFREVPVILKLLTHLRFSPDVFMFDGQGIAHPRGLGIAAHIGALLNVPAIGVAKSRLCGTYEDLGLLKGSQSVLHYKGRQVGTVLRSKDNVKPLFISPGHRINFSSAVNIVNQCLTKYKLPEPTRLADKLSKFQKE